MFASANFFGMTRKGARPPADPDSAEEKLRARLRRWLQHFEREGEGLKRYELADHMKISPPHLSNLLNGKAKIGIDAFVKMAKFGKSLEYMAMFEPPKPTTASPPVQADAAANDEHRTARKQARRLKT